MSIDLYYGATPYHFLLSIALASSNDQNTNYLLAAPNFPKGRGFIECLQSSPENPFKSVHILTQTYGENQIGVWLSHREQSIEAKKIVEELAPGRVFVGVDKSAASQSILHNSPTGSVRIHYEDGTAAYSKNTRNPKPKWKCFLAKISYGWWFEDVNVLGTSRWIDRIALTHPDEVRPELKNYPIDKISSSPLQRMNIEWVRPFISTLNIDFDTLFNLKSMILVAHSDFVEDNNKYFRTLQAKISNFEEVGVKYHPREPKEDYLCVHDLNNVSIIPQSLPAELIYLIADNLSTVTGTTSTALLTANWLDDEINVISLAGSLDIGNDYLKDTFRSSNIRIV